MWWQAGRLVLAVLLGQVVFGLMSASADADPAGDAQALYCTKSDNVRPLVDTAVALGLADHGTRGTRLKTGGHDLRVSEWRTRSPADFVRACATLVAARKLPRAASGGSFKDLVTTLIGLIPVGVGAALALGSGALTSKRATAERVAGELHTAVTAYDRACRACLVAWRRGEGRSLEDAMDAPISGLLAELRRCRSRHPRWRVPERLIAAIKTMDRDIRDGEWPTESDALPGSVKERLNRLDALHEDLMGVVAALDRPFRWHRVMTTAEPKTPVDAS